MSLKKGDKDISLLKKIPVSLATKDITDNGTYKASDDGLDGYSEVNVATSGVDINDYFNKKIDGRSYSYSAGSWVESIKNLPLLEFNGTNANYLFYNYKGESIDLSKVDFSNSTNMSDTFYGCSNISNFNFINKKTGENVKADSLFSWCSSLKEIPDIDYSEMVTMNNAFSNTSLSNINIEFPKVTSIGGAFSYCQELISVEYLNLPVCEGAYGLFRGCSKLEEVKVLNIPKATSISQLFFECVYLKSIPAIIADDVVDVHYVAHASASLTNVGGFLNLGKAYSTSADENYYSYTLNLQAGSLTHDSLMNVINGLYDIATKGVKAQQLELGSINLAELTAEEIAIATNKGWSVS